MSWFVTSALTLLHPIYTQFVSKGIQKCPKLRYSRGLGTGDTTTAQCIAGDTSASSVHRWVTSLIVSRFYHQLMS
ncbi:MAG: hypothetical protein KA716_24500 [Gloeotrichia echinulata DEX184]|nr:hypothetical protein [Gloeotrichia echinulata DEX184]